MSGRRDPVRIVTDYGDVRLYGPYDDTVVERAHHLDGTFLRNPIDHSTCWRFDARDEKRVRDLALEVYGTDGSDPGELLVTVQVDVPTGTDRTKELRYAGTAWAWRPGRDQPVVLAPGVVLVAGGFKAWGGSQRYPDLNAEPGTVLEVRDVPAGQAALMCRQARPSGSVRPAGTDDSRAALEREHDRLVAQAAELAARATEIKRLLEQTQLGCDACRDIGPRLVAPGTSGREPAAT